MAENNDVDNSSKLGHRQLNDKKQLRVPDEALKEIDAETGDSIGFKNCEDEDFVKICKVEVDF